MASVNDSTPSPTSANIAATSTDKLNDLIETLKDGQLGFAAAADSGEGERYSEGKPNSIPG